MTDHDNNETPTTDLPSTEVLRRFSYHPAKTTKTQLTHDMVRLHHRELAAWIEDVMPNSREKALALTALQESMMWCNAAVAYRLED